MGGKLSKQEELFVLRCWPDLLENAMTTDAECLGEGKRDGFRMSFQEWQALITLLDNVTPNEVPSRLCASLTGAQCTSPLIPLTMHACCWFDGSINDLTFSQRTEHVRVALNASHRSAHKRKEKSKNDTNASSCSSSASEAGNGYDESETQLAYIALDVFDEIMPHDKSASTAKDSKKSSLGKSKSKSSSAAVDSLVAWRPERPVVTLSHAFLVAVVASRTMSPTHAESAISALRGLQDVMRSAVQTAKADTTRVTDITSWPILRRLESALWRRQKETDAAELIAGRGGRWWRYSMEELALAGSPLAKMSPEARWDAAGAQYVGQRHVWNALRTHFLSSDIFDAEKPTVIVFFGPSGFGKSEMAKRVAAAVHGVELADVETSGKLVHIHLPSFCTKDSIYSLVDPPAAHVGEGVLLSALRRCGDAVVVLDEFEKGTAEAIQNLWLSAFQKKGTLRSLKDASRSVSTERATFVLTCNIASETILRGERRYLRATAEEQSTMRNEWTTQCKELCRRTMHDPFVNRVDYFFPFVPYTAEEKRRFIELQLRRVLTDQRKKGRCVYVTPRMVDALAARLHTFHASTIEGVVRPLLVEMVQNKWNAAVLTAEERMTGTAFVALRADGDACDWRAVADADADAALAAWNAEEQTDAPSAVAHVKQTQELHKGNANDTPKRNVVSSCMTGKSDGTVFAITPAPVEVEKEMHLDTMLEKDLRVELARVKELLLEKDKEILYLKETIRQLETVVAILLLTTLCSFLLLSLVLGTKVVLIMSGSLALALCLLVKMPLKLLLGALRALYGILGPFGSAIFTAVTAVWLATTARSAAYC